MDETEIDEEIVASYDKYGPVHPAIRTQYGLAAGNRRKRLKPEWPEREVKVKDYYEHLKIEYIDNIRVQKPDEWATDLLRRAGNELVKQGLEPGKIASRLIEDFPMGKNKIYRCMPQEFKDPSKVKAGQASGMSRSVPDPGTESSPSLVGLSRTSPVRELGKRKAFTPQEMKLFRGFSGLGFDIKAQHPVPMDKWKCGKCRREWVEQPPTVCPKDGTVPEQLTYKVDLLLDDKWGVEPGRGRKHDFESDKERDQFLFDNAIRVYHYDNKLVDAPGGVELIVERHRLIRSLSMSEKHVVRVEGHVRRLFVDEKEVLPGQTFSTTLPTEIKFTQSKS